MQTTLSGCSADGLATYIHSQMRNRRNIFNQNENIVQHPSPLQLSLFSHDQICGLMYDTY